jgi:MFS family permease
MAPWTDGQLLSSMAFAGTIVGMLVFGAMSDFIGRKVGMLIAVRP